ncbi:DNA repair protein RadA/Sms [Herbinix hemicellulosilytica]|uniref:DNA repair protein RadA n=1 Tax=Herbinix hemicellulosilytica TaxID=1564487 RepID=A0A0H5SI31_HERHM|nr:DNA repair protein RadA [Herbinix hemicellulosilytica]RBP59764.1 DNA repair protein RadA/Sms [Herbinix hemicellulosilytica]CRZ35152.1 DNA repair protein RadA homolog [Herbinix hemicellulosilytica]
MAKAKTLFFCKECGYESSKWLGQCPGCRQWDTFVEEPVVSKTLSVSARKEIKEPVLLSDVKAETETRVVSGIGELDRVLGGGIVPGSLVLVGGDPGIGKSTLLLQMCREVVKQGRKVIYISGEESREQIKMRADRLGAFGGELLLLCETNLDLIEAVVHKYKPEIIVIDSIQTMYKEDIASAPGSVSQVREATGALMRLAKDIGITIFIIGHVTKEGMVAGPRVLEHMVDTVLYFEGENHVSYRVLRAVKNRFGSTNEIGVFEMLNSGLKEVKNPSEYMLSGRPVGEPGSVVTASIEGTRPILVEVQALISRTSFNMPRRTAAGTDYNRVNLLMAVLEKRLGLQLGDCDAYVNVAGGMRITEPALDLAIVAAILSSYRNISVNGNTIVFGEIGLTGEIRAVNLADQRVSEAAKMGFETCILPKANEANLKVNTGIKLIGISNIQEILQYIKENR